MKKELKKCFHSETLLESIFIHIPKMKTSMLPQSAKQIRFQQWPLFDLLQIINFIRLRPRG